MDCEMTLSNERPNAAEGLQAHGIGRAKAELQNPCDQNGDGKTRGRFLRARSRAEISGL